jgi:hypothetical protein
MNELPDDEDLVRIACLEHGAEMLKGFNEVLAVVLAREAKLRSALVNIAANTEDSAVLTRDQLWWKLNVIHAIARAALENANA